VLNTTRGMEAELFVVDNDSDDGSIAYLQPLFPSVQFISNRQNLGFAKANNQALAQCSGEYVLFLNPDTLVPEDCLALCLAHIKSNPQAGALGVRMLDARGRFLPESKRSFPSPIVAFWKLIGMAALFPRSGFFNRYALGNLNENQNHTVEVLAGAFMLVKRELLIKLNGFDETYFLYGEDIDLSYRIQKAGFANLYFAETAIIHFKGESSAKHELTRVKYFYQSMLVFVQKHYNTGAGKLFSVFLQMAIGLRATVSALHKMIKPIVFPATDVLLVWISLWIMKSIWISQIRNGKDFGVGFVLYALPLFSTGFVLAAAVTGLYDRKYQTSKALASLAFAVISILALYSLLPENIRFSRGVIFWGGILGAIFILLLRKLKGTKEEDSATQMVVVATENEYEAIGQLLQKAVLDQQLLGRISPDENDTHSLGELKQIPALLKNRTIGRIIFCVGRLSLSEVIKQVHELKKYPVQFLFHFAGTGSIVGSHTLAPDFALVTPFADYRISYAYQQRMKRLVDIILGLFLFISFPFHPHPLKLVRNIFTVLSGKQTWVGYASAAAILPPIKIGVISSVPDMQGTNNEFDEKADRLYAKNYDWWQDVLLILQNYRRLG
jgi:GT2 family glycosyltransferase